MALKLAFIVMVVVGCEVALWVHDSEGSCTMVSLLGFVCETVAVLEKNTEAVCSTLGVFVNDFVMLLYVLRSVIDDVRVGVSETLNVPEAVSELVDSWLRDGDHDCESSEVGDADADAVDDCSSVKVA